VEHILDPLQNVDRQNVEVRIVNIKMYLDITNFSQDCQMVCFQTKNHNLGKLLRTLDGKMLIYFMGSMSSRTTPTRTTASRTTATCTMASRTTATRFMATRLIWQLVS
jgi:hypothetical protein